VPARLTVCGLPGSESVTITLANRLPEALGVNVTLMRQFAPAARLVPQVLVCAKSALLAPPIMMLVIVNGPLPLFVNVILLAELVVPTIRLAKVKAVGDTLTAEMPVPLRLTV
jgi:hypothetical protein